VHRSIGAVLGELLAALFSVLARQVSLHQRCMLARNLLVFASEVLWRFFREINGASGELGDHGAHLVHAGLIERAGAEALAPAAVHLLDGELCGDTGLVCAVKESREGTGALHKKLHRPNHFAAHAANCIKQIVMGAGMFEVQVVDLKDYALPMFAEEMSPAYGPPKEEVAGRWQKKMAEFDAYIFTAAEYNIGPTAVLKNALDYAYKEWANKPVAFVGYGGVGGARAIEQLRLNAIELQMAPIRTAVHILFPAYLAVVKEGKKPGEFDYLSQNAKDMLNQCCGGRSP
jgi:NAD(P)H-dependent FMN reductase